MKIDWNKRYTTIAIYAFLVILCVVFFVFLILDFNTFWHYVVKFLSVFNPVFYGIGITYLLCPSVNFFEKRVFRVLERKNKYRMKRTLSVLCTFILAVVLLVLFLWRILPSVFRGYADLQNVSGLYLETVKTWLLGLSSGEGALAGYIEKITEYSISLLDKIYGAIFSSVPDVGSLAGAAFGILKDFFLGVILAIYFLLAKERLVAQIKKIGRALFDSGKYAALAKGANLADKKFGGYIKGQIADALIIGSVCFICTSIIGIPYYPLVSTLVGIACVIPVFGLLIGTLVGAFIILLADPMEMVWFVLFMMVLHQVNKHMIRPRVIRSGVDASSIFMFTAIIVMTGLLGFWGLIIGVPVFTILYTILYDATERRLARKGLATDTCEYYSTEAGRELHDEMTRKKEARRSHTHSGVEDEADAVFTEELPCVSDEDAVSCEKGAADETDAQDARDEALEDSLKK